LALGVTSIAAGGKGGLAPGIALGMSGQYINGLINEDIKVKLGERKAAGEASGHAVNLLHLHEERMGNRSKAIEATKLAYYDNILQQMDAYKADHAGEINEGAYLTMQSDILEHRAMTANALGKQEQADITDEVANKYKDAQYIGAGAGVKNISNQVKLSDGTTYALDTEQLQKTALAELQLRQRLQANSQEILRERAKLRKSNPLPGSEDYQTGVAMLNQLQKERMDSYSVASGQGVNTKNDVEREEKYGTLATSGFGKIQSAGKSAISYSPLTDAERNAADTVYRRDIQRQDEYQRQMMAAMRARVVKEGYNRDPKTNELTPVASYTGREPKPAPALPPAGSTSRDPNVKDMPTSPAEPVSKTAPKVPIVSGRPTDLPTPAAHHGRSKKKK
jgi:hypothetical protein